MARKKPQKKKQETQPLQKVTSSSKGFTIRKVDWAWVAIAIVLLVTLIIRWKFINIPFERDEGTYTYFGQLILDGKIPYVDFYEMKLPGIYYCYALIVFLFGATLKGVHIAMLVVNLATVYFIFRIASLWYNKYTGVAVALAFSFLSMTPFASGFTTQSEHLVAFFLSAGLLLMLKGLEKNNMKLYFFSGLLFCCSLLVKQNGAFFMLFGGLSVTTHYLLNKSLDWKNAFLSGLVFTAGAAVPLLSVSVIIASQGAWDEFVYWVYTYPQSYVGGINWDPQGRELFNYAYGNITSNIMAFVYMAGAGIVLTLLSSQSWHKKIMLILFCTLSALSITPGLRFYGHYWLYLMPAVAVAIGGLIFSMDELLKKHVKSQYVKYIPFVMFGIGFTHHWVKQGNDQRITDYYTKPDDTNILRTVYGQNPFPESKVIGDLIKQNSTSEDKIAVFGSEPQIFFYADRRGVSKHNYVAYLVDKTPQAVGFQKEFITDVEAAMPKFLVYFRHPVSWLTQNEADRTIFSWFDSFANEHYKLIGLSQVLGPNQLIYRWGEKEALTELQSLRQQEQQLRQSLAELNKNAAANQQSIANIQYQLQMFNFEIIVFERKDT